MNAILAMSFSEYMEFYRHFLMKQWYHMTPAGYTTILVGVLVFGWLLMKSGAKTN